MEDSKTSEKPLSPEIIKLTEKLASDPKSKLFVPLAEEYIKSGMLDEAQSVLEDGLKLHPNFMSAKTTLGKVYFEKGQLKEAKILFEGLIAASPDNLFAQRRLARIYHEEGRFDLAQKSCRAVLAVSPKDEEMVSLLDAMSRAPQAGPESGAPSRPPDVSTHLETTAQPKRPAGETAPSGPAEPQLTQTPPVTREPVNAGPFDQTERIVVDEILPSSSDSNPSAVPESGAETETAKPNTGGIEAGSAKTDQEFPWSEEKSGPEGGTPVEGDLATESLADLYVKQGYYDKGKEIYRKILERDPSHSAVRRKLEETESLMAILSKGDSHETGIAPVPAHQNEPGGIRPAEPEMPKPDERRTTTDKKIKRLEAWLESLRKGQQK